VTKFVDKSFGFKNNASERILERKRKGDKHDRKRGGDDLTLRYFISFRRFT